MTRWFRRRALKNRGHWNENATEGDNVFAFARWQHITTCWSHFRPTLQQGRAICRQHVSWQQRRRRWAEPTTWLTLDSWCRADDDEHVTGLNATPSSTERSSLTTQIYSNKYTVCGEVAGLTRNHCAAKYASPPPHSWAVHNAVRLGR